MPNRKRFTTTEDLLIRQRNENGDSINSLAKEYATAHATIESAIRRAGGLPINHKGRGGRKPQTTESMDRQLAQEYEDRTTIQELMNKYNMGKKQITNSIRRGGGTIRRRGYDAQTLTAEQETEVVRLYANMWSMADIAREVDVPFRSVRETLEAAGIEIRKNRTGTKNVIWKPSVITKNTEAGQRKFVKPHPDNVAFVMAGTSGYVAEHRFNMAQHIGRPLTEDESVHHIDGDIENNDISNLQLRTRYHGKGQVRACGDCGSTNIISKPLT